MEKVAQIFYNENYADEDELEDSDRHEKMNFKIFTKTITEEIENCNKFNISNNSRENKNNKKNNNNNFFEKEEDIQMEDYNLNNNFNDNFDINGVYDINNYDFNEFEPFENGNNINNENNDIGGFENGFDNLDNWNLN